MKKALLFAIIVAIMLTFSSSADIFSENSVNTSDKMFEEFCLTGDPDFDLEVFAKKNGLNKNEARKILSKKFGDPKRPDDKAFMKIARTGDPEADLRNFALEHNISTDEAKIILEKMFGEPEMPQ